MNSSFVFELRIGRVVFGNGARAQLPQEMDALGMKRAVVLTTPQQRQLGQSVADSLGERCAGIHAEAVMHVPVETARQAVEAVRQLGGDGCIAAGGGSTIGLAKAIALESDLPIIALPTTYAGSEVTPLYGLTEGGLKKTGRDWRVLPKTVIYDPELTYELPVAMSMTSGMNAIAHAAEALYAPNGNPIISLMAEEGIRSLVRALPKIKSAPRDPVARQDAIYGAWLCGTVLGNAQMGIHHKICHTLGGFNLPHAEMHTVVLPYALAYNAQFAPEAMAAIGRAVGHDDAVKGLAEFSRSLDVPLSLRELGMSQDGLARAADLIVATPYPNPRPIERAAILDLLQRAFAGASPF